MIQLYGSEAKGLEILGFAWITVSPQREISDAESVTLHADNEAVEFSRK